MSNEIIASLNDYAVFCKSNNFPLSSKIALQRAIAMEKNNPNLWSNYGTALYGLNDYAGAERAYNNAILLSPLENVPKLKAAPYNNMGLLRSVQGDYVEAEKYYNKALEINPNHIDTKWDLSMMYLDKGDWKKGLELYDNRIQLKGPRDFPKFPYPVWNGEDLSGKTIFIQAEQGMGDRILFSRYLSWLKKKYPTCKIIYIIESNVVPLFWEFRNTVEFLPCGVPWPEADYGIYQMSLMKFHKSRVNKVPRDPGFIFKRVFPSSNKINLPAPRTKSLKVGICWTGNAGQDLNRFRSIPLELMLSLAEHPKVTLYNLQVGSGDIKRLGAGELICDWSENFKDSFVSTGQVMLNLDLVITVCTSVAHLAGTLGVPCWTLLCNAPYWVWLKEGETSMWYPNTKLFRQKVPGEWSDLINNVKEQLFRLADTKIQ